MSWFEDIPAWFLIILAVVGAIGAVIFISSLDFNNPDSVDKNMEKTTGYVAENVVPTEINWIVWIVDHVKNPYLLTILVLGIFWLFGYFTKKP